MPIFGNNQLFSFLDSKPRLSAILKILLIIGFLYLFIIAITLLGHSFKLMGKEVAESIFEATTNPILGLVIGILATSVIQSSSTTTSIVVGLVGSGIISLPNAVPIIMGANVGTSVTNTIVSLAHISHKEEFRRAFAGSTVHDFFNLCTVIVLLPLELLTGYLNKSATFLAGVLSGASTGATFESPLKVITKPPGDVIKHWVIDSLGFSKTVAGTVLVVVGVILLIISLTALAKLMQSLVLHRVRAFFERSLGRSVR